MRTVQGTWVLVAVAVVLETDRYVLGQHPEPWATLRGHTRIVTSLAFSPNGRTLASASCDSTVRLWEVFTGKQRALLEHPDEVYAVRFAPTGRLLASGGYGVEVRLWDAVGRRLHSLRIPGGKVGGLCFSPDGTTVAVASEGGKPAWHLCLLDVRTGKQRLALRGHGGPVTAASFSADGRMLAGGDESGGVTVWESTSGKVRASLKGHGREVLSVAFGRGGDRLAWGSADGSARLWDLRTGKQRPLLDVRYGWVTCVALARTGGLAASTGTYLNTIRLWDTASCKQLLALELESKGWTVAFSPDSKLLAVGDGAGTIRIWSVPKLLAQRSKK